MQVRILAAVGAWVVGATAATALSLLAVSFLGQDVASGQAPLLTADDVNRSLAAPTATPGAPETTGPTETPSASATSSSSSAAGSSTKPATTTTQPPVSRVLSVTGGSAVARCQGQTVYLVSWSPAQGYLVAKVERGPAAFSNVQFMRSGAMSFLRATCAAGIPVVASHQGDDGVGDH
jgi:hypothetical protein